MFYVVFTNNYSLVVGSVDTENMDNGMKEVLDKLDENSFMTVYVIQLMIFKRFLVAMNGEVKKTMMVVRLQPLAYQLMIFKKS